MLQPFELFNERYLERLITLKKFYLVSQSYKRGFNHFADAHKIDILVTDYESAGEAQMHLNAVKNDKYGALIDLQKPEHKKKVLDMLLGEKYQLYWSIVKSADDLQKRLQASYKDKMRRYIESNTDWRIGGDETITPSIETTYGELFINLKWRTKRLRIKFEDIERY
ncbi:MAG: hypothetical protein V4556_00755 [Bacteroidota bacterium]